MCTSVLMLDAENIEHSSLTELISEALANNPQIQRAQAQLKSAQTRIAEFRYLNDPVIGVEFADNMRMYSISQQVPFPTKLFTLSKIAGKETIQYEHSLEEKTQDIISQVKKKYAELFYVNKKIETTKKSIDFLKQLYHIASRSYALGDVTQTDILRAQVELTIAEENLRNLTDDRRIAEARLNLLLNRDLSTPLANPRSLPIEESLLAFDALDGDAASHHPTLEKLTTQQEQASLLVSLAKQKYLPDFIAKYTQIERNTDIAEKRYMVGLTVPIWFWSKQKNMVAETKANLLTIEKNRENIENEIFLSIKDNSLHVEKNKRIVDLYKISIIPQAEANLKSAYTAYETNQIDFLNLLESEKILIQYELDYYRAQADLFIAIASLEKATGISVIND